MKRDSHKMVRRTLPATTVVAAVSLALLAFILAGVPVEAKWCHSRDIFPAGANFSSPALVVDLEGCTELRLLRNSIGDSGAAAVAEVLMNNTAITSLKLGNNNIGDSGAAAFAEALKGNTAVTELYLSFNSIGDSGAAALAEALKSNTALTTLDLRNNNIGDNGAAAIAELKRSNKLQFLYLHNNNITCGIHGTQRTGYVNVARYKRICRCSGIWSGDFCDIDVPGKAVLATTLSVVVVAVLAWVMVSIVYPDYIRPYRERKQEERAFGIAHPINVTTLGGDAYTLEDWGHCKDLKLALKKLAPPGELGDPSTFVLLDNDGWTAPPDGGAGASAT